MNAEEALEMLARHGVVTLKAEDANTCCGLARDEDGFCQHRPGHLIYVGTTEPKTCRAGLGPCGEKAVAEIPSRPIYDDGDLQFWPVCQEHREDAEAAGFTGIRNL